MRTKRDGLFRGTGPDVSEEIGPLAQAGTILARRGLATMVCRPLRDHQREGPLSANQFWRSFTTNLGKRAWKLPCRAHCRDSSDDRRCAKVPARHLADAVGFKYIGSMRENKIALAARESFRGSRRGQFGRNKMASWRVCWLRKYGGRRAAAFHSTPNSPASKNGREFGRCGRIAPQRRNRSTTR